MSSPEALSLQLFHASGAGRLEEVKLLAFNPSISPNWQDQDGFTPLILACQEGQTEVISFFLHHVGDLDVNLPQDKGVTPFFMACQEGHVEVVRLLLGDPRIDVNKPRKTGFTPLSMACYQGHREVVSLLLGDPRIHVNQPRETGATPFLMACQNGHVDVVELLLNDPRIDINSPTKDRSTPLWFAAQFGHLEVVKILLASGRELDLKTSSLFNNKTAAEQARFRAKRIKLHDESDQEYEEKTSGCAQVAELIERFELDQEGVRRGLRRELGFDGIFLHFLHLLSLFCFLLFRV